jgi:hypothetical protein
VTAILRGHDAHTFRWDADVPQDEWQDTLADAAKTDEKNSPWEIDMYRVIAHDAPDVHDQSGAPSDARQRREGINRVPAPPANRSNS